jgi:tetratricopeptide (TPR) repeat protein
MTTVVFLAMTVEAGEELSSLRAAFLRGEFGQVVTEAQGFLQRKQSSQLYQETLYLKGLSELKVRDLEAARETLTRLTAEFPQGPFSHQAQMALGDAESLLGRNEQALLIYQGLADRQNAPLYPQAAFRLGNAQRRLGLWEEARKTFERLAAQSPGSAEALHAKGLLAQGEFAFSVQVGAFQSRENALRLKKELDRRNFSADVSDVILEGRRFYRVRVGQFARREQAAQEAQRLRQEGFPTKIVP